MTNQSLNFDLTDDELKTLTTLYPGLSLAKQVEKYLADTLNQASPNVSNPNSMANLSNTRVTAACLVFYEQFSKYLEKHIDNMSIKDILDLSEHPYVQKMDKYLDNHIMSGQLKELTTYITSMTYTGYPEELNKFIGFDHNWHGAGLSITAEQLGKDGEALLSQPSDNIYTFKKSHHGFLSNWIDPILAEDDDTALSRVRDAAKNVFAPGAKYTWYTNNGEEEDYLTINEALIKKLKDAKLYDYSREPASTSGLPFFIL